MRHFTPKQLAEHLEKTTSSPFLLDVREPWEFDICHIKDSLLIPMRHVQVKIENLDKSKETVVICHHGIRSRQVAMILESLGFIDVINLSGGVDAWAQDVDSEMTQY